MNSDSMITTAITTITVGIALYYLAKLSSREVSQDAQGFTEIRTHRFFQILGIVSVLIALIFIIAALYYRDLAMIIMTFFMLLLFGVVGVLLILTYKNHFVRFNEHFFTVKSVMGKYYEMKWEDVALVNYNGLSGYLIMKSKSGEKIKISPYLMGFKSFLKTMNQQTRFNSKDLGIPFL